MKRPSEPQQVHAFQQKRLAVKGELLRPLLDLSDTRVNRQCGADDGPIIIARHPGKKPNAHAYLLDWLARTVPEVRAHFKLSLLPCRRENLQNHSLLAAWVQDPAVDWMTPAAFAAAETLERRCDEHQIPVINRVRNLSQAVKSLAARTFTRLGLQTPRIGCIADPERFTETLDGLKPPLIVRDDRRHAAEMFLVRNRAQARQIPWHKLTTPIAAEYIDVADPVDGKFRKYRTLVAGDNVVPRHLIISSGWEVRARARLSDSRSLSEELAFLTRVDPNHRVLAAACRALQLDVVAFDYSYDRAGRLVIWEANPTPNLSYPVGTGTDYTKPFVERSWAAIVDAYLQRAGLPEDARLDDWLAEHKNIAAVSGDQQGRTTGLRAC